MVNKKTILVIDDDEAVRKAFELAFDDSGFQVETAESGEKGIEMEKENSYDMIFLDLKMPSMDGVQALREIRKIDPDVPVYIVTAFNVEYHEMLQGAEVDGLKFEVLQKPLGGDQIIVVAESALGPIIPEL